MIYLYDGGGAGITEIRGPLVSEGEWQRTKGSASRLLFAKRQSVAATLLGRIPFEWVDATNYFNDVFSALRTVIPVDEYVTLQEAQHNKSIEHPFKAIADTITEISPNRPMVRFVVMQLDTETDSSLQVSTPSPKITSESVNSALADAELLARSRGPATAVDRAHTAVHAYLRAALVRAGQEVLPLASATDLFKQLREHDEGLRSLVEGGDHSKRIIMALASIVDATNTLRNTASAAHPSAQMLQSAEAMLVINAARSLIHYLDAKLNKSS